MPPRKRGKAALHFIEPQLATLVDTVPGGDGWIHEVKFDGYRGQCLIENRGARILTRRGHDWTAKFPGVAAAAAKLPAGQAIIDGEIVALLPDGRSSFSELVQRLHSDPPGTTILYAFDLLHQDGEDLRGLPLGERKRRLVKLLGGSRKRSTGVVRYSDHVTGKSKTVLDEACRRGLEGVVSKCAGDPYRSGRTRSWLKIKCVNRQEFVVVGYTDPKGSRLGIGALLLAVREKGAYRYAGRVGTGMNEEMLQSLRKKLAAQRSKEATVSLPKGLSSAGIHWLEPRMVVEVAFTEWTPDGRLRHPALIGLREDKSPRSVVREVPAIPRRSKRK